MSNQVGRLSGAAMRNLSWRSLALKNVRRCASCPRLPAPRRSRNGRKEGGRFPRPNPAPSSRPLLTHNPPLLPRVSPPPRAPLTTPPQHTQHWLKFERTNKVVTKHISPFEQNVMTNMADAKFLKGGAVKQIEAIVFDMSPGILFLFGTYYWGNWQFKKNVDSLRS